MGAVIPNPYAVLRLVLGGPLHPGGHRATEELLDRAGVTEGTRLVDLGCGAGEAVSLARARGARAMGVDRHPVGDGVRGVLSHLPLADTGWDVALSECTLCLAADLDGALAEARRVLVPGGHLALSDVTLQAPLAHVEAPLARALCLDGPRARGHLLAAVQRAGFELVDTRDHRDDLLAMRDQLRARLDVEGLLAALGSRGARLQDAVDEIELAVEEGTLGYVSLVARRPER